MTAKETPVTLTEAARAELSKLMSDEDFDRAFYLRVGVKGGGCSGVSYVLGFDYKQEGDDEFEVAGIRTIISKQHRIYLAGMEIDFSNGLNNRGFTFTKQ